MPFSKGRGLLRELAYFVNFGVLPSLAPLTNNYLMLSKWVIGQEKPKMYLRIVLKRYGIRVIKNVWFNLHGSEGGRQT